MDVDQRAREDVAMVRDQDSWPMWPVLPLKKGAPSFASACLFAPASDAGPWLVYLRNVWALTFSPDGSDVKEYDSPEAIVADGWMVD